MKLTAQKKVFGITPSILAIIVQEITDYVVKQEQCDCLESCTCGARFVGTSKMLAEGQCVTLSYYGESVGLKLIENSLEVNYQTCGGTRHDVTIDLQSGFLVTSSDGKRNSNGWGMAELSGTLKGILEKEKQKGWDLISLETSQPDWGVWHWLAGKLKDGPTNLREAEDIINEPDPICYHCNKDFKICEQCGF